MKLSLKQTQCLDILEDKIHNKIIFGGGAGGGKSMIGCYWVLKNCLKHAGTRWLIGRAVLKTLKDTTLLSLWEVLKLQGIGNNVYDYNQQQNTIKFINGSEILLKDLAYYPSDANFDQLGSLEITGAFLDECNQISHKAWEIVGSRIRYKLDENNLIPKILGTCNPSKNWVYQEYYKPSRDNTIEPGKRFIQSLLDDNPFISKHYKANLQSIKDKNTKERLLFGNWEYDSSEYTLIEFDAICDLFTNQVQESKDNFISCDVARFGEDKTVIMVWSGLEVVRIITESKTKINLLVTRIKELQKEYTVRASHIVIDSDGVGGGAADFIPGCKQFVNNRTSKNNFQNIKTECYYKLSEYINQGLIAIKPTDHQEFITQELETLEAVNTDKDTKQQIISKDRIKEKIGRSPDFADCLMFRMYYEIQPLHKAVIRRIR